MTAPGDQSDDAVDTGGISVDLAVEGNESVIRLRGEFDLSARDRVRALASTALERDNVTVLVFDMAELTFLDSSGLSALIEIRERAGDVGVELHLRNVPQRIMRLFQITGVAELFDVRR